MVPQESSAIAVTADDVEDSCTCKILDSSYIKQCSQIMANAFVNSPIYYYIFQDFADQQQRIECLQWLFERNLQLIFQKTSTALRGILLQQPIDNDNADNEQEQQHHERQRKKIVIACFLWTPSKYSKSTFWELMSVGLWEMPFRFGYQTTKRMLNLLDILDTDFMNALKKYESSSCDATTTSHAATAAGDGNNNSNVRRPFIVVERMVVCPNYHGKGYGTKALGSVLKKELLTDDCGGGDDDDNKEKEVWLTTQEERNVQFYSKLGFQVVDKLGYSNILKPTTTSNTNNNHVDRSYYSWTLVYNSKKISNNNTNSSK